MSKILLVYDDFAELNATELSLKKCNFDVIGLTNEYTVKDQIVAFNPEILVGFGNSQRVSSLSIGKKIKDMNRWGGKSILIFPKGYELPADDLLRMRMDMLLESPISVIRLIQIICKLTKQDEKSIIEKLAKSFAKDRTDNLAFAAYDADTVKVIQHIQGELDNLNSDKATGNLPGVDNSASFLSSPLVEEKPIEVKKSFFEKDEVEPVTGGDPFAALISELKGEVPKEAAPPTTAKAKVADTESANNEVLGQKLKQEIAVRSGALADKVKKYTALTEGLHLYPESTIKKVKAKKQLAELKKDWNPEDLQSQDEARRQFVSHLFDDKKNGKKSNK